MRAHIAVLLVVWDENIPILRQSFPRDVAEPASFDVLGLRAIKIAPGGVVSQHSNVLQFVRAPGSAPMPVLVGLKR